MTTEDEAAEARLQVEIGDRIDTTRKLIEGGAPIHCEATILRNQLTILKALDELLRRPAGVKV
jgi:hypothetical protein